MSIYDLGAMEKRRMDAMSRRPLSKAAKLKSDIDKTIRCRMLETFAWLGQAHDIIADIASAGIELDDERLSYMTIQVDRDLVERAKKWLEGGES